MPSHSARSPPSLLLSLLPLLLLLPCATALPPLRTLVHNWLHLGAHHPNPRHIPPHTPPHPRKPPLPSYITGATTNHTRLATHYARTMMHRPEIHLLASYLQPHHVYLEFGAGGSTLAFAPLVRRAYSIEHNCKWARYISHRVHPLASAVSVRCVPVVRGMHAWGTLSPYEHADYRQFRHYVDAVDTVPENAFDRVFIDGRARLACALKILPRLNNHSLVFIHDFYTRLPHYKPVLEYYTEVSRVLATQNTDPAQGPIDEPQGLVVLRRKPGTRHNLTTADIDAIYDSIDWRFPFGPPLTSIPRYLVYYIKLAVDPGRWARARNVDDTLWMVRRDVFALSVLYILISLVVGNSGMVKHWFAGRGNSVNGGSGVSSGSGISANGVDARGAEVGNRADVRFVETEAMKAVSARRKRAGSMGRLA